MSGQCHIKYLARPDTVFYIQSDTVFDIQSDTVFDIQSDIGYRKGKETGNYYINNVVRRLKLLTLTCMGRANCTPPPPLLGFFALY